MKKSLNEEVQRLQKLAGIEEVKVANPKQPFTATLLDDDADGTGELMYELQYQNHEDQMIGYTGGVNDTNRDGFIRVNASEENEDEEKRPTIAMFGKVPGVTLDSDQWGKYIFIPFNMIKFPAGESPSDFEGREFDEDED